MVDISGIEDAVPRNEPVSRYGNPASYVVYGKRYYTMPSSKGHRERGIASWYGTKFHGQRTSSGETYDMYKMTAAHKTLPLPSYVEVRNLRNNRTIVVKVNDRGPFVHDRIIDLSYVAAAKLGIQEDGTGLVEIRALDAETPRQAAIPAARQNVPQPAPQATRSPATKHVVATGIPARTPLEAQPVPAAGVPLPATIVAQPAPAAGIPPAATTGAQPAPMAGMPAPATATVQAADNRPLQTSAVTPAVQAGTPQTRRLADKTVFLQVGAYRVFKNAEIMALKVEKHYPGSIRIAEVNDSKGAHLQGTDWSAGRRSRGPGRLRMT